MVEYVPPPADLSRLNPIQRYMQKGTLEWSDYFWLCVVVAVYLIARPAIRKFIMGKDQAEAEGEYERGKYQERRAKVGLNNIREGKAEPEDITAATETTASGANVKNDAGGEVLNRKPKGSKVPKSEADKLLNWDDEGSAAEPSRTTAEGGKSDVAAWLDKWDK